MDGIGIHMILLNYSDIGQHFVTTSVVHLPNRTETILITESDQSRANHVQSSIFKRTS